MISRPCSPPAWTHLPGDISILFFLVAFAFFLHHDALDLWWTYDDPYILELAVFHNPLDFFLRPEIYQKMSIVNFTPLLIPPYALNYHMFGLEPEWFYAYEILLLAILSHGIFLILRSRHFLVALWAALLFLLTGPAAFSSRVLMTHHYLEGACCSFLAVTLLRSSYENGLAAGRCWLAAAAYLAACLCKEVYIPLILSVPFLVKGSWRTKCRRLVPFLCALAVYIPWRFWILGNFGGYHDTWWSNWQDWPLIIEGWTGFSVHFWSLPGKNVSAGFLAALYAAGMAAAVISLLKVKKHDTLLLISMLTVGALFPVIPMLRPISDTGILSYRFTLHIVFLMTLGAGCFFAAILRKVSSGRWKNCFNAGIMIMLIAALFFAAENQKIFLDHTLNPMLKQHARENLFFYTEDAGKTLVTATAGHHWAALACMRKVLEHDASPAVCNAPFDLRNNTDTRYYCYRTALNGFSDCSDSFTRQLKAFLHSISGSIPVKVSLCFTKGRFILDLGPLHPPGEFHMLLGIRPDIYEDYQVLPRMSGQLYCSDHPLYLRVARKLSDSRWVLSPEWIIRLDKDQVIEWSNLGAFPVCPTPLQ